MTGGCATRTPGDRGMTLLELVAVMSLLILFAAALAPAVSRSGDARRKRAVLDCARIAEALAAYTRDTKLSPVGPTAGATLDCLIGDLGRTPSFQRVGAPSRSAALATVTRENTWRNPRWRGPYLEVCQADPWGQAYVCWTSAASRGIGASPWVVSAGPDGVLDTHAQDQILSGDDVGVLVP